MDGDNRLQFKEKPGLEGMLTVTFVDTVTEAREISKCPKNGYERGKKAVKVTFFRDQSTENEESVKAVGNLRLPRCPGDAKHTGNSEESIVKGVRGEDLSQQWSTWVTFEKAISVDQWE